ncbi:MAG: LCP family protein, partial [Rectinemataceae bacterium]|nr:LCP family protein [Rectinemataceae bacterium]
MKPINLDKTHILLAIIVIICAIALATMFLAFRADEVDRAIRSDKIMNILFVMEREGKPAVSELFMFHPATGRSALLDIPAETGLILETQKRMDRLETVYDSRKPVAYIAELRRLIDAPVDHWLIFDEKTFMKTVDLIEGLEVFVPNPVKSLGPPPVLLPGGALVLDGDKAMQYAFHADSAETDAETVARRQKVFQSFIRRIAQKNDYLRRRDVFSAFAPGIKTNLSSDALLRFLSETGKMDVDRIVLQKITGTIRIVDDKKFLFPHYDGELVKDIVRQTINALSIADVSSSTGKTYTVEILNGTDSKGLAKSAADIYQSFGYDIAALGNTDKTDSTRTVIIDRYGDPAVAKTVGSVIRCENISQTTTDSTVVA